MNVDRLIIRRENMKCSDVAKYLSPYVDGELKAQDRAHVEAHLAQCPQCAEALEQLKALSGLFSQAERFQAPVGFSARIMEKIDSNSSFGFTFWPMFTRFAGVAAILLAITGGVISGGVLFNPASTHRKGVAVVSALSLESLDVLPPGSLGGAYLAVAEEKR
jgi:anti-sigma factor (TIGR02949 family)